MKPGLQLEIVNGRIVISVPFDVLVFAVMQQSCMDGLRVVDEENFVRDIVRELESEEEDGTTPLHHLFDKAALAAMEQGSESLDEAERPSHERRSVPRGGARRWAAAKAHRAE